MICRLTAKWATTKAWSLFHLSAPFISESFNCGNPTSRAEEAASALSLSLKKYENDGRQWTLEPNSQKSFSSSLSKNATESAIDKVHSNYMQSAWNFTLTHRIAGEERDHGAPICEQIKKELHRWMVNSEYNNRAKYWQYIYIYIRFDSQYKNSEIFQSITRHLKYKGMHRWALKTIYSYYSLNYSEPLKQGAYKGVKTAQMTNNVRLTCQRSFSFFLGDSPDEVELLCVVETPIYWILVNPINNSSLMNTR